MSGKNACPECLHPKAIRAELCRACWRRKPRKVYTTNPRSARQYAREHFPLAEKCERCGAPATDRHHVDGDPLNNVAENIASLCRRCHMAVDGRLRWRLGKQETHCRRGHPLNAENTYISPQGKRKCRTCARAYWRLYAARKRGGLA